MAITLAATLRNNRLDQITAFAGAGAKLRVYTAAYAAVLYESVCSATLAPAASGGVLTANVIANATATGVGVAAIARLYKADGTTMVTEGLTVGTSGTNIVITNTTIAINDVVTTSSFTITEGNP
ncbi:hypothetical protein UFOVP61_44 [uncultured Caudovirales phage]|uniref:Uncharacterized protein n=1 Tax=uncultured Caudovirales phage TaxID=2100421 RepID=A0A6J5KR44_9CAUD|nr:hypothetical protein UFOVP61_44 [uncultured Caudovirales phage]